MKLIRADCIYPKILKKSKGKLYGFDFKEMELNTFIYLRYMKSSVTYVCEWCYDVVGRGASNNQGPTPALFIFSKAPLIVCSNTSYLRGLERRPSKPISSI